MEKMHQLHQESKSTRDKLSLKKSPRSPLKDIPSRIFQKNILPQKKQNKKINLNDDENMIKYKQPAQNRNLSKKAPKDKDLQISFSKLQRIKEEKDQYPSAQKIKVVFVGDGSSGKTSMLVSYTTDEFDPLYTPTVFDSHLAIVKWGEQIIKLQLWDTAGQDEYKKLRTISYPDTDIFVICFSLTEAKSFKNATTKWLNQVKGVSNKSQILFVGTKLDIEGEGDPTLLQNSKFQQMNQQKMRKKITSSGYKMLVCSAVTQKGLKEVFDESIRLYLKKKKGKKQTYKQQTDSECQLI